MPRPVNASTAKNNGMKKTTLLAFGLIASAAIMAQVALNIQLPVSGLKVKSQLWNISIINSGNNSINARMEMIMTDISNNQPVLTATTNLFLLPAGVKQLTVTDLSPIIYNAVSPRYNLDANPDGFLPIGIFNVCYSVEVQNNDAHSQVAELCETIEVEPISPPRLITPSDSEHVVLTRPVFTWLPPSPTVLFNLLTYDWVLTEVYPMQKGEEALQLNTPLLKQQDLTNNTLQYPQSLPELDTSKLYAWGITAKNNFYPIAKSEVWTFRVKQNSVKRTSAAEYYVRLKREEDAAFVVCSGLLRYEYQNEFNDSIIHINVYDITGSAHEPINLRQKDFKVRTGSNYLQIDLPQNGRFSDKHVYLFELTNERRERWYLKFEYRKQE